MKIRIKLPTKLDRPKFFLFICLGVTVVSLAAAILCQYIAVNVLGYQGSVYRINTELELKKFVSIEVTNVPLRVEVYDGDTIKVNYVNETNLIIEENDYSCTIMQDPEFAFSLFARDMFDYQLEILLPDIFYNSIDIATTSGDVQLLDVYSGKFYLHGRSADITITEANGDLTVFSESGNVSCDFSELPQLATITTTLGNVVVGMPDTQAVQLDFMTESGHFTSDFFTFKYNDYDGDVFCTIGENPKNIQVFTDSGNLKFYKKQVVF